MRQLRENEMSKELIDAAAKHLCRTTTYTEDQAMYFLTTFAADIRKAVLEEAAEMYDGINAGLTWAGSEISGLLRKMAEGGDDA